MGLTTKGGRALNPKPYRTHRITEQRLVLKGGAEGAVLAAAHPGAQRLHAAGKREFKKDY